MYLQGLLPKVTQCYTKNSVWITWSQIVKFLFVIIQIICFSQRRSWSHLLEINIFFQNIFSPFETPGFPDQPLVSYSSSVKWSAPGQPPKAQGKLIFSFPCTLFYIFSTPKITDKILKSTLLSFFAIFKYCIKNPIFFFSSYKNGINNHK